ncbi:MAG: hypothetical protein KBC64_02005 [Simkaniaceae bacterium]|nr:hypothetical protein [Simkaniaceae bacterium]
MSINTISFTPSQQRAEELPVVDPKSTAALQMSPYLALVMAFVASANAEEQVQSQAGNSLKVQEERAVEVEDAQTAMEDQAGGANPTLTQLQESAYMQSVNSQSQVLSAKTTAINMSVQEIVQNGITNSSAREEAALQAGSGVIRVLQNLTRGMH